MWANYGQVRLQHIGRPVTGLAMGPARPRIVQMGTTPSTPCWWADQTRDKIRLLFSTIEIGNCVGRVSGFWSHENGAFVGRHLDVRSTLVPFTAKTISDFQKKTFKACACTKRSFMDFLA